jgi:hypothetical protein
MSGELDLDVNELPENSNHSFVIKIWLEERNSETGSLLWRGHITHIASGQKRYFQQLNDVLPFITSYLLEWS